MMIRPVPTAITYRFERGDLWHLARAIYRPSWAKRLLLPLAAMALMLGVVVYNLGGWPSGRQWGALLRRPELIAMTIGLVLLWANLNWCSILALVARFRSFAIADKDIRVSFSESGLDADVEGVASHIRWPKFTARIEAADRVLLKIARWEAVTIPRRAFADDASWQGALAFVREKVPHAG